MTAFRKRTMLADRASAMVIKSIALFLLLLLVVFTGYIMFKGAAAFSPDMFSFDRTGIGAQLFNTIYIVFLSLLISVPIGVSAGIYMAEYLKEGRLSNTLRTCIETLSSLPSIVVGLFGFLVFIMMTHSRWNLMAGALTVSILNLPLITSVTEDALRSLPSSYREGSFGLGASHWQTIVRVLLPAAIPRIMTGVILAAGRGFGEAAALLYTAGMSTDININNWDITSPMCALNPFRPGETLALLIWATRTESLAANASQIADLSAAVLIVLVFVFSLGSRALGSVLERRMTGGGNGGSAKIKKAGAPTAKKPG